MKINPGLYISSSLSGYMCLATLFFAFHGICDGAELDFNGNSLRVLKYDAPTSSGLERIYVAYNLNGVSASFQSETPVRWFSFSNLGGGFAQEETNVIHDGDKWTLTNIKGDTGYIVESEGRQYCFWIVDYSAHRLSVKSLSPSPESDCDATILLADGEGDPIHYFTILGQQQTLSREIVVSYRSLDWDSEKCQFNEIDKTTILENFSQELRISPPALCQTQFILNGDRFLQAWNWGIEVISPAIAPISVEAYTSASQTNIPDSEIKSNVIKTENEGALGGSAPVSIDFQAWVSDAVAHSEWQFARDQTFSTLENRIFSQDISFDFMEEGIYYARFIASNSDGSCETIGDTYTIVIGASDLKIPNAFSPNGDGINDEWKVAYKSLLSFECWIFDRYGNQICHLEAPDQGWDGKRGGKTVPPGVYYYVIQATGADGKKYKESGDINILRSEAVPKE